MIEVVKNWVKDDEKGRNTKRKLSEITNLSYSTSPVVSTILHRKGL